jgi:ABC-type sugar transport system substrate-binding protein
MKKRFAATVMAGVLSAAMLAGCGGSAASSSAALPATGESSASAISRDKNAVSTSVSSGSTDANKSGIDIKVVVKTLSDDYWQYVMRGCQQAGKDLGVQVDVVGATSQTAYDEQLNQIETIVNSGEGDAMVVAPLQADTVATQIANYDKPVIAIDTEVPSDKVLSFVGFDNEDMGKLAGEAGVKAAKEAGWNKVSAVMIAGVQGDPTSEACLKGFEEGVKNQGGVYYENETQYGEGTADKAVNCMEGIIQTHPEGVSVIFCNYDDMAMAAARAAQSYDAYKNTIFIGAGGTAAGLQSILNGEVTMTVTFDGYDVGYKGVQAAVDAVKGKQLESFIASKGSVVGKDEAQETLDLVNKRLKG